MYVENRGQHRNGEAQVPDCITFFYLPNLPRSEDIFSARSFHFLLSILHYQIGSRVVINLGRKAQAARGKVNMLDARLPSVLPSFDPIDLSPRLLAYKA